MRTRKTLNILWHYWKLHSKGNLKTCRILYHSITSISTEFWALTEALNNFRCSRYPRPEKTEEIFSHLCWFYFEENERESEIFALDTRSRDVLIENLWNCSHTQSSQFELFWFCIKRVSINGLDTASLAMVESKNSIYCRKTQFGNFNGMEIYKI